MFPFVFSAFLCCFVSNKKKNVAIIVLGLIGTTGLNWYYPFPSFAHVKLSGKFAVGLRQFRLKNSDNLVSVFYPAKKSENRDFMPWL